MCVIIKQVDVFIWKCLDECVIWEYYNKCVESATSRNIDVYWAERLDTCVSWEKKNTIFEFKTFYLCLFVELEHY